MASPSPSAPDSFSVRLLNRAEEWIYRLNEKNHWFFRLYDLGNEWWARLTFRGVKRRAGGIDVELQGRDGVGRMRLLTPADDDVFASFLAEFDSKYGPPHLRDRATAERILRRASYLPFGHFVEGRLIGYHLVRLFFPRRAATAAWFLRDYINLGLGSAGARETAAFTRKEGIADYITVPLDNPNSLRAAQAGGWEIVRTNSRFHVLLRR